MGTENVVNLEDEKRESNDFAEELDSIVSNCLTIDAYGYSERVRVQKGGVSGVSDNFSTHKKEAGAETELEGRTIGEH